MSKRLSVRTVRYNEDVTKAKKMKSIRDFTSQLKREVESLQNQHVRDQESSLEDLKRKQEVEMETLKMKHNQMLLDATGVEEDSHKCGKCRADQDEDAEDDYFACSECDLWFSKSHLKESNAITPHHHHYTSSITIIPPPPP